MNQFKPSYSRLKGLLASSVAVIGLTGIAQGQVAELRRLMDNKDFGGSAGFYMPVGNALTGMLFGSVKGGLLDGQKNGEILGGYGQSLGGNIGIRGYAGVELQEGKNNNLFTAAKAGAELYIGGLGLHVSGSVPFGKTKQVARKGHSDVVLVDPSGQQCDPTGACVPPQSSCSNPLPGQVRHCEIGVAVTDPSYEKALKGFEVGLDYQLQVGGVWLRPSLGYYRYGKNEVSGAKAGLEVSVPLTSQLSLNIGAGVQKELKRDKKGLSGFSSLGISYHFGSVPVSQLSALEHRFAEAPTRNQRTLTTQTKQGNTVVYRNQRTSGQGVNGVTPDVGAIWDQNTRRHFVSNVYLIDAATASQLDDVVAAAEEDSIVVVDGTRGFINLDNTIEFKNAGVGVVGGGGGLHVLTTIDGGKTFRDDIVILPGKRPDINQGDRLQDAFYANGVENPIIYGLDIRGGKNGVNFIGAKLGRIYDVISTDAFNTGFSFIGSENVKLWYARTFLKSYVATPAIRKGVYFEDSSHADIYSLGVYGTSSDIYDIGVQVIGSSGARLGDIVGTHAKIGLKMQNSDNSYIQQLKMTDVGTGIDLQNVNKADIRRLTIDKAAATGLHVQNSYNPVLYDIDIKNSATGIFFEQSVKADLSQVSISSTVTGIFFEQSANAHLTSISVSSAVTGIFFEKSANAFLSSVSVSSTTNYGIRFLESDKAQLNLMNITQSRNGIYIDKSNETVLNQTNIRNTNFGVTFVNSNSNYLWDMNITSSAYNAIILRQSKGGSLNNINITDVAQGAISLYDSNDFIINNVYIKGLQPHSVGIELVNVAKLPGNIKFNNVLVESAEYGYKFDKNSSVAELMHNNAAKSVVHVCDGMYDADGFVRVANLNTGATEFCR